MRKIFEIFEIFENIRKWLDIRRWEVLGAENICELKRPGRSIHFGESSPAAHSWLGHDPPISTLLVHSGFHCTLS